MDSLQRTIDFAFQLDEIMEMILTHLSAKDLATLTTVSRCQFHQHFTRSFFVRKCLEQLFSSYVLALSKGSWQKSTLFIKTWSKNVDKIDHRTLNTSVKRYISHLLSDKTRTDSVEKFRRTNNHLVLWEA